MALYCSPRPGTHRPHSSTASPPALLAVAALAGLAALCALAPSPRSGPGCAADAGTQRSGKDGGQVRR
jgi:hypothetical protein